LTNSACAAEQTDASRTFIAKHCAECHDAETREGNLDLTALDPSKLSTAAQLEAWVKVHDRVRDGEMPPPKQQRPEVTTTNAFIAALAADLRLVDAARQQRDGRTRLRRLNRTEFEATLRDLLSLPGLKLKESLPEDGKSHGFDRLSGALDMSYVHMELYLAAVDKALNEALCPLPEQPPVFKHRYSPWKLNIHNGKECEFGVSLAVQNRTGILLNGMQRDETYVCETAHRIVDAEPLATAFGLFRHEDADYRCSLTAIKPVLSGLHRLRVSGYSFDWDGKQVVPTERHGALGWGIHSKGEHFGTVDLPPNAPAVREISAWLERGGGMIHGTDDNLRIIAASAENFRDYAHGKNKDVLGPLSPAPGVAVEWVEIEGPIHDQWPPASHRALFGDLPVKEWRQDSGVPLPAQQQWPKGNPGSFPKDIYGERGEKRPKVYVATNEPVKDADRLLRTFLPRAYRRPVIDSEVTGYVALVKERLEQGDAFQDAMLVAYRAILTSPEFLLLHERSGKLDDYALASRLSYFLWNSIPDAELTALAERKELSTPKMLRAQTERLLNDPKSSRFVENFLGQWLSLREIGATQPDRKLYPEFMPWLQEAMLKESHAYFGELVRHNLGVTHLVQSDFAMLNEPLARLYGINDVKGWDLRRVTLPPGSKRGGFLTQGSVLKTTANGTTTSPVKRGAYVMEKLLGVVPTPPPPDVGSVEPDTRGATTIRDQLAKHRRNSACASCHQKMDGYGFALESFDVVGQWRDKYRALGGVGQSGPPRLVHGRGIEYHDGLAVDCSGQMPNGRAFDDVDELRALLVAEPERLAQAFALHLATYATGGEVTFADRSVITAIVARSKPEKYGIRSLIHEVVQSQIFLHK